LSRPDAQIDSGGNEAKSVSWDQQFFDPVILPNGRTLIKLRDAANYIVKLPKAEQQASQWQTAAEVLMLVGEHVATTSRSGWPESRRSSCASRGPQHQQRRAAS
jgi:hypothetical protein